MKLAWQTENRFFRIRNQSANKIKTFFPKAWRKTFHTRTEKDEQQIREKKKKMWDTIAWVAPYVILGLRRWRKLIVNAHKHMHKNVCRGNTTGVHNFGVSVFVHHFLSQKMYFQNELADVRLDGKHTHTRCKGCEGGHREKSYATMEHLSTQEVGWLKTPDFNTIINKHGK